MAWRFKKQHSPKSNDVIFSLSSSLSDYSQTALRSKYLQKATNAVVELSDVIKNFQKSVKDADPNSTASENEIICLFKTRLTAEFELSSLLWEMKDRQRAVKNLKLLNSLVSKEKYGSFTDWKLLIPCQLVSFIPLLLLRSHF